MYYNNALQSEILNYLIHCCQTGDGRALERLGLGQSDDRIRQLVVKIETMNTSEVYALSGSSEAFARLRIDQQAFRSAYPACTRSPDTLVVPSQNFDLLRAICSHVSLLYQDGAGSCLEQLGLPEQEACLMSRLSLVQVRQLAGLLWRFVTIQIDAIRLERGHTAAVATTHWYRNCGQLIRAGAPRELMARYYGMSSDMYMMARDMHARNLRSGRPRVLPMEVQSRMYREFVRQYHSYRRGNADPFHDPQFFVDIYKTLNGQVSLREIWTLAQIWLSDPTAYEKIRLQAFRGRDEGHLDLPRLRQPRIAPKPASSSTRDAPPLKTASNDT